ncbi:hypothetical protein AOQ84DRAFT_106511 [Glonium stellatum]|uniref:Uncharacterized protein n=1 Tax=Glonium stellatum TaxID=574774 RepID=A0A8E2EU53_9PEZI|nr:hypothetical protein AOQ84DRAFT_106511 [Glonium stellatum]
MDAASQTIGSPFQAAIRWILLVLEWYIWQPLMAFAACSRDRDSRCSASQPIGMDLERAPSMTSERHPSSTTSCQSTVPSHEQIIAGLKGQQKAYPKEFSTGLRYQRPIEPAEAMWHKILCIYLDGRTARNLSFNSIDLFPETEKEILRLLWERTKGHQIRDTIYSALLFEYLRDRPDAIIFQTFSKTWSGILRRKAWREFSFGGRLYLVWSLDSGYLYLD